MGSSSKSYDEELSNGESSSKGNDTSLIVNVNDTHSDIENESNNSNQSDNDDDQDNSSDSKMKQESGHSRKSNRNESSHRKKSPARDPKPRSSKVDLSKTRYLWVSGIPIGTKTNQLEEIFAEHGKVLAIKIIRGGNMSLLGFVKLETFEQAQKCMEKLNKTEFRGNKIELFKERPVDKDDNKKTEKIGFRESRKYIPKPPLLPKRGFRPSRGSFRGSSKSIPTKYPPRVHTHEIRRQEREEAMRLERERQKLKLERMKLERDKAELLKMERESRYEREQRVVGHEEKRIRSMVKRPFEDSFIHEDKRYDDYNRREDFSIRRYDARGSSPQERKINPRSFPSISSRGRYDDNVRQDRYSDNKYDSAKSWQTMNDNSWMSSSVGSSADRGWNSNYDAPRIVSSTIGSTTISRLHSSADLSQNISSRNYFNNRRY